MAEKKVKEEISPEEKEKRRRRGKYAKTLGNTIERVYMNIFKDAGWDKCKTARHASKLTDDSGVDLIFIPLNLQIKAGAQMGMKPAEVLRYMAEEVKKNFPETSQEYSNPNVVVHHKMLPLHSGQKRTEFDSIVHLTWDTFFNLLCQLHDKGKYPKITLLSEESGELQIMRETPEGERSTEENQ